MVYNEIYREIYFAVIRVDDKSIARIKMIINSSG